MALSFVRKGTAATGNATSITVPLPAYSAGHLAIIYVYTCAYAGGTTLTWNCPSGWTQFIDYKSASYGAMFAAYKVLSSSESNPSVSFSGPSKNSIIGCVMLWTGFDASIFDVSATYQEGTSAASNTITSITTSHDNAYALYIYGIKDNLTSTITNLTEQDDTGTAAGDDAQAAFAIKQVTTAGAVGSATLTYTASGVGFVVFKLAIREAVNVSVSPSAASCVANTTNPTTVLGLISFAPNPTGCAATTTNPTVLGQGILFEVFTELGGSMGIASYALLYDGAGDEIASTGGYVQGTGMAISDIENIGGNLWTADIAAIDIVSATVGTIKIYDENDIKICSWTFQPALTIELDEFDFLWPEEGITFPSPQWITPTAATSDISTTNPTVVYGSLAVAPTYSSADIDTSDPTIPANPTVTTYLVGNPANASYVLILDDNGDEIASTGNYVQGTGISLTGVSFTNNSLIAADFVFDIVAETTIQYIDVYDSDDYKIARWDLVTSQTLSLEEFTFQWPDAGIQYLDYIVDVYPDPVSAYISTIDPTILFGSAVGEPSAAIAVISTTDPTVLISLAGSVLFMPDSISCNINTTNPEIILGSLVLSPDPVITNIKTVPPIVWEFTRFTNLKITMDFEF